MTLASGRPASIGASSDAGPSSDAGASPDERADLATWRDERRRRGERVVVAFGDFELLDPAGVEVLRAARGLADALLVALRDDASIAAERGRGRPLVPLDERRELIEALRWVDTTAEFAGTTPDDLLRQVLPDVVALARGQTLAAELVAELRAGGTDVVTLPPQGYPDYSTESLLRAAREIPDEPAAG